MQPRPHLEYSSGCGVGTLRRRRQLLELVVCNLEVLTRRRIIHLRTPIWDAHRLEANEDQHTPVKGDSISDLHSRSDSFDRHSRGRSGSLNRAVTAHGSLAFEPLMLSPWLQDLESLEAISQNDDARKIFLRMAAMSHAGRLPNFIAEVAHDQELDETTKGHLTELANDRSFLLAVEEYLRRTQLVH